MKILSDVVFKNPKIYFVAGRARHGKDTFSEYLKNIYEENGKRVVILHIAKYIKDYAKVISDWDGNEENKPRVLLQELGTDFIRSKLGMDKIFINRIIEDIKVYSYFFDIIIVSDARFPLELEIGKENFGKKMKSIYIFNPNPESKLSLDEAMHSTETSLEGYNNYDRELECNTLEEIYDRALEVFKEDNI